MEVGSTAPGQGVRLRWSVLWRRALLVVVFVVNAYLMLLAATWAILDAFDARRSHGVPSSLMWIGAASIAPATALGVRHLLRRDSRRSMSALLTGLLAGGVVATVIFSLALGSIGID